jgi:hypothetical protein
MIQIEAAFPCAPAGTDVGKRIAVAVLLEEARGRGAKGPCAHVEGARAAVEAHIRVAIGVERLRLLGVALDNAQTRRRTSDHTWPPWRPHP